jgi:hypothetical protein
MDRSLDRRPGEAAGLAVGSIVASAFGNGELSALFGSRRGALFFWAFRRGFRFLALGESN